MTNDIGRRTDEHRREYGKLSGSKIVLQYICIIDPEYISEAEKYLSNVFDIANNKLSHKKYSELIVTNNKTLNKIKNEYIRANDQFCVRLKNVSNILKEEQHKTEIVRLEYENKILELEKEITELKLKKELSEQKSENMILKLTHELEIMK